jgi:hypothetical protein
MRLKRVSTICSLLLALAPAALRGQQVSVYATGLDGPRGLEFGPDGMLYVAEAGRGGANSTVGLCLQVPPPVGPYFGGATARVSRITPSGERVAFVEGLPSGISSLPSGDTEGVADVTFIGGNLYAVLAGGGCSHGNPAVPNGVIRVNIEHGTWRYVDNLSEFFQSHQVARPEPQDFEPDGTPFTIIAHDGRLYVVEANQGQIVRVNPGGRTERLIDFSAVIGHEVPTSIAFHDGVFYVGTLGLFPIQPGSAVVYRVSLDGKIIGAIGGFTTITGLAFDNKGRLYVLELSAAPGFPQPGAGKLVRVSSTGAIEDFVTGLVVPTGLTYGPDGALYVSNFGAAPPGLGQILRVAIPD